jgi:ABC-type sulfate/molybdate transport systems ATPase subunit
MLRDKGKALKQTTGLKFAASTIEGDIMSQRISLHAFQVLVHLNSLNAVFVNPANRVYAEFISDAVSDKPVHIIERNDKNTTRVTMTTTQATELASIRATNYRIETLQKPIKSASAYTVAELTEMCHQLKIQLKPKMKKQELYDAITKQLVL